MSAPLRQSKEERCPKSVTRPFRFGVVCPLTTDLRAWRDRVRRIADSGYSTLLMPDVPGWQQIGRASCRERVVASVLAVRGEKEQTRAGLVGSGNVAIVAIG